MEKWTYQGLSPNDGRIYHKGRWILQVYENNIKLWHIPEGNVMFPCHADSEQVRIKGKGTDRKQTFDWGKNNPYLLSQSVDGAKSQT